MVEKFEEAYAMLPADGWLTEAEALLLWTCASLTEGDILEVGCYKGRSTCLLASLDRTVHAVDPFEGFSDSESSDAIYKQFIRNVSRYPNVVLHNMRIEEWHTRPMGFAYLDGDHTYLGTTMQIRIALECMPRAICVHDVNDSGEGKEVKRACLDVLGPWNERVGRMAAWLLK